MYHISSGVPIHKCQSEFNEAYLFEEIVECGETRFENKNSVCDSESYYDNQNDENPSKINEIESEFQPDFSDRGYELAEFELGNSNCDYDPFWVNKSQSKNNSNKNLNYTVDNLHCMNENEIRADLMYEFLNPDYDYNQSIVNGYVTAEYERYEHFSYKCDQFSTTDTANETDGN